MNDVTTHVGILYVELFIGSAQSLKDKRSVLGSLKDRIRCKFNVSVAELDGHDKWQVCTMGLTMIGTDNRYIDSTLQNVVSFIEGNPLVEICGHEIQFC